MKTFRQVLEDMSLAPKGKGREGAKKLYKASYEEPEVPNEEDEIDEGLFSKRNKASDATRAKLSKPYDSSAKRATKVKVKNAITDLDHIAWQFENQFDTADGTDIASIKSASRYIQKVTNKIDRIMKDLKSLQDIL